MALDTEISPIFLDLEETLLSMPNLSPIPRPSAAAYAREASRTPAESPPEAAKVKFRLKGNEDGHIYQGQEIVVKCRTCPGTRPIS
jgi:hypothetical protein